MRNSTRLFVRGVSAVLSAGVGAPLAAAAMSLLCTLAFPNAATADHQLGVIDALVNGMLYFGGCVGFATVLVPGRRRIYTFLPLLASLGIIAAICSHAHADVPEAASILLLTLGSLLPVSLFAGLLRVLTVKPVALPSA